MGPRSNTELETALDPSAGVGAIVSEAASLLTNAPVILVLYLVVAVLALASESLANVASIVAEAIAIVIAYRALGGSPEDDVSFGIRLVVALVAAFVAGLAILVGLLLLVVPGLYLITRLRLTVAAVMLEDCGPLEALGRSFELTEGRTWTVFGVVAVFGGLGLALAAGLAIAMGAFAGGSIDIAALERATSVARAIQALLISPVAVAADAVMYGLYAGDGRSGRPSGDASDYGRSGSPRRE